ncbi:hypothetical protein K470DRAFT_256909 [Piedraia hortae CBS 480.64]|uniref:RING-type domain-containing protein n=1 Tax=Piedraia hortae CBS 480.64 TaxID=1314780 RepID=A0A6A7C206_9PEZI|nr:hypothetical protein K470DRAFT_256909 [Piedraia hortae CBS 480.64]
MHLSRLVLAVAISVCTLCGLLYMSTSMTSPDEGAGVAKTLFSWRGTTYLFPPSAIISLLGDNSTFFLARPAAFGPRLPRKSLNGQLWIGSGFGNDALGNGGVEGELGCSDLPNWEGVEPKRATVELLSPPDDGTDDHLHSHRHGNTRNTPSEHADIQTLQEGAEIAGKIVLLSRGGCGFLEKVKWVQRRGGIAMIVGDDTRGGPLVTMYARGDTANVSIPSLFTSHTTALLLSSLSPGSLLFEGFPTEESTTEPSATRIAWFKSRPSSESVTSELPTPTTPLKKSSPSTSLKRPSITTSLLTSVSTPTISPTETGLWLTLTPTTISTSPFLDTLLVLVISPLITLTAVYALLLLRSRVRARRWRAPKSLVDQLPVRTYFDDDECREVTPLLQRRKVEVGGGEGTLRGRENEGSSTGNNKGSSVYSSQEISAGATSRMGGQRSEERKMAKLLSSQKECAVCLDDYVSGLSRVMQLPCGHGFHVECITPWLTTKRRTCPICKGDVVRLVRDFGLPHGEQEGRRDTSRGDLERG